MLDVYCHAYCALALINAGLYTLCTSIFHKSYHARRSVYRQQAASYLARSKCLCYYHAALVLHSYLHLHVFLLFSTCTIRASASKLSGRGLFNYSFKDWSFSLFAGLSSHLGLAGVENVFRPSLICIAPCVHHFKQTFLLTAHFCS